MRSLVDVRADERWLVWVLLSVLAVNTLVIEVSEVVSTAGFVSTMGPAPLLGLWPVDMLAMVLAATGYALIADRVGRLGLVTGLLCGLAVLYVLIALLFRYGAPAWLTYPLVYVVADQALTVFPLAVWALANDVCEPASAKRLFPVIAAGTAIGSVLGGGLAVGIGIDLRLGSIHPGQLLGLASVLFLGAVAILRLGFRGRAPRVRRTHDAAGLRETIRVGLDHFTHIPSMRYLAPTLLLGQLGMTIVEYRFLSTLSTSLSGHLAAMTTFLGLFKLALIGTTLICEWFVVGRLVARVEVRRGFLGLPATIAVAGGWAMAAAGPVGAAGARFVTRLVEWSWDEPVRKMFQGLLPAERRGRVAAFMDTYFYAVGTVLGCVVLASTLGATGVPGWLSAAQTSWLLWALALGCGVAAGWFALQVNRTYDESLLNWRFSRSRRRSVLDRIDL